MYNIIPQVCSEETMAEILNRYLPYNTHAASYTWKFNGNNVELVNISAML